MSYFICGIQQMGIGNDNVYKTWEFYRKNLGMDLPIFDEEAEAGLMLPYTGGEKRKRHAVLALNFQGGGGIEVWQYTERKPEPPKQKIQIGDLGIFSAKYKAKDVQKVYNNMQAAGITLFTSPQKDTAGTVHFYANDLHGNLFEIVESEDWYTSGLSDTGGIYGASIGVTDMDKSTDFYKNILGYDVVLYDETKSFDDFNEISVTTETYRRVNLTHSEKRKGPFSQLLGKSIIELVESKDRKPNKIYEGRLWGDPGYIHLCFDIVGMPSLKEKCESMGHPFTVDSANSFDMGEAAGQFCYIEDPDGTLIEFVETHKIPILKKLNWYLDLRKRARDKSLPSWMLKALSLNRVKKSVEK
jgi:catechol 2,3-dioxygenase-like lactoylglutathione lyase family enzyme